LLDLVSVVVFTVVLLTVSFLLALSFFAVSGLTVESTLVVELESTFDESAVLPDLLPLHAARDSDRTNAINDGRI
jgi:hypothetical protein